MKLRTTPVDALSWVDLGYLYGILAARLSEPENNISHKAMPTWEQHENFVANKPYLGHYIIEENLGGKWMYIGCCYVTKQKEIGIFIQPAERRFAFGTWIVLDLMKRWEPGPFFANIALKNEGSVKFFKSLGFAELRRDEKQIVMVSDALLTRSDVA